MTAAERRLQIRSLLADRDQPVTGSELAQQLGVSRQVIVQDVALLRAAGAPILATPQGYLITRTNPTQPYRAVLACRHDVQGTGPELNTMIDEGLRVVDVVVEHQLYGELRGMLMLETRADVREFVDKVQQGGAQLLSTLTQGVHLHTVEASRPEAIERAREALRRAGFLVLDE